MSRTGTTNPPDADEYRWIKVVERHICPLMINLICRGITDSETKRVLGSKLGHDFYVYLDGHVYMTDESERNADSKLEAIVRDRGLDVIEQFPEVWYDAADDLLRAAELSQKQTNAADAELADTIEDITNRYADLSTSLMLVLPVESYLEREILSLLRERKREHAEEDIYVLTFPEKKNENERESASLESIITALREQDISLDTLTPELEQRIEEHRQTYGWINADRSFRDAWTREDILHRIEDKLKHSSSTDTASPRGFDELAHELELSPEETRLVRIGKEYVFLRTYRMDTFVRAGFLMRDILLETAKRLRISFEDVIHLTPEEIIRALRNEKPVSRHSIRERRERFGFAIWEGGSATFSGSEYDDFTKKYFPNRKGVEQGDVHGVVAHKGVISGTVKVVKSIADIEKVRRGDILVAPMTVPSFVPAMEKAAAFVTDEGGILCHAAIVSREMGKPCIIGTKNATSVLQDGDMVEVNADAGVVRKIA